MGKSLVSVMDVHFNLQQDPTLLLGCTHISGGVTPGQLSLVQYSQCPPPDTCTPLASTWVEHQGFGSPSMVVHVVWTRPPKVKGKTQLPHEVEPPEPLPGAEVVGADVGGADPSEQVPDSSPTAIIANLFSIKTRALSATPSSPKEVPVGP